MFEVGAVNGWAISPWWVLARFAILGAIPVWYCWRWMSWIDQKIIVVMRMKRKHRKDPMEREEGGSNLGV